MALALLLRLQFRASLLLQLLLSGNSVPLVYLYIFYDMATSKYFCFSCVTKTSSNENKKNYATVYLTFSLPSD